MPKNGVSSSTNFFKGCRAICRAAVRCDPAVFLPDCIERICAGGAWILLGIQKAMGIDPVAFFSACQQQYAETAIT
jgi:hypothetical protein